MKKLELEAELARLRAAEAALEKDLRFETLLSELSAGFVNLPADEVDRAVESWLERICVSLDGERIGLHQFAKDGRRLVMTHSFAVPGVKPAPKGVTSEEMPWFTENIRRGEAYVTRRVIEELPPQAINERRFVLDEGSKSMLIAPLKAGGEILGALVVGAIRSHRDWSERLLHRLRLVGEVFANALARRRYENALRESRERFERAFADAAVGMAIYDPEGRYLEANAFFSGLLGFAPHELRGRNVIDVTHPEDREISRKRIAQALDGEIEYFGIEKRYLARDDRTVWAYVSCSLLRDHDRSPLYFVAHIQDVSERNRMRALLDETNTALKVLLDHREREKSEVRRDVLAALDKLVFPYLEKLEATPLDRGQGDYLEMLRANLREIAAPFAHRLVALERRLTPAELRVADLVRRGKSSQEVADLLRLSLPAVFFHRNNIRRKLGLRKSKTNLRAYLESLE